MHLSSRVVTLVKHPAQLQVVEPHLEESVHVTRGAEIRQANKRVLGGGEGTKKNKQKRTNSLERTVNNIIILRYL